MSRIQVVWEDFISELKLMYFFRFADMEMAIVAVEALSRFRFELANNQEEVKPAYGFVTKPDKEIFVNVSRMS